jgi:flagella basal body P-ring formation protein FlgA
MDTTDADGRITLGDLFDGVSGPGRQCGRRRPHGSRPPCSTPARCRSRPAAPASTGPTATASAASSSAKASTTAASRPALRAPASQVGAKAPTWKFLPTPAASAAGEIVQPQDLVWVKMAGAPIDAPRDADAIIGLAAKRPLREGAAVQTRDVSAAQVIKTGDLVTITYDDGRNFSFASRESHGRRRHGRSSSPSRTRSPRKSSRRSPPALGPPPSVRRPRALQARSQPVRFAAR